MSLGRLPSAFGGLKHQSEGLGVVGSKPAAPTKNPAQLTQLSATLPPRLAGMVFARPAAAQSEQNAAPAALPGAVIPAKARTRLLSTRRGARLGRGGRKTHYNLHQADGSASQNPTLQRLFPMKK